MLALKGMRNACGITQEDMATRLNISQPAYHKYENGKAKIPQDIASKIADILGVKMNDIFLPEYFTIRNNCDIVIAKSN